MLCCTKDVGKTSFLIAFTSSKLFDATEYTPTVIDKCSTTVIVDDKSVQLELWDSAGQEEYCRVRPLSYPQTDVFLLCFSIADRVSFANVRHIWIGELAQYCPKTPILLVGCKTDARDDADVLKALARRNRTTPVTFDEGEALARSIGARHYLECSAKTRDGLKQVFDEAARIVLSNDNAGAPPKVGACTLL